MSTGDYNIITGEIKQNFPLNSISRRFSSQVDMQKAKKTGHYVQPLPSKIRRLGTFSDSKAFHYTLIPSNNFSKTIDSSTLRGNGPIFKTIDPPAQRTHHQATSLINASKLDFDLITHAQQPKSMQSLNARRLGPISKEAHQGRSNAPNYSKDFAARVTRNQTEFHRKKSACTELCHIQRSYGVERLFRKYK